MKRYLMTFFIRFVILLTAAAILTACTGKKKEQYVMRVALVTDYGDVDDQSFNQFSYEGCHKYCDEKHVDFQYFKPKEDSHDYRVAAIEDAIAAKYNVLVLPGFVFAPIVVELSDKYPSVRFVGIDVAAPDVYAAAESLGKSDYHLPINAFCGSYRDDVAGYLAGYAACMEGYRRFGFLGGMPVPSVVRYGYGYLLGINEAAVEMGGASEVNVIYAYGGQFYGDELITNEIAQWYRGGTEVIFACGGGIWTSVCEAAAQYHKKVIGVDNDQSGVINSYESGMCITSAVKNIEVTVRRVLETIEKGEFDSELGGQLKVMGLVSGKYIEDNFVGIPTDTWSMANFSLDDYHQLVYDVFSGHTPVEVDITEQPSLSINVKMLPNLK